MRTMLMLRMVLMLLAGALAVALVVNGNVVIGLLVGAMAVVRLVMTVTVVRRRREAARRFRERLPRGR